MKIYMKTLPLKTSLVAAGMTLVASLAQAESDKLSVSGFIDMSTVYTSVDGGASTASSGLDQVEFDLAYDFGDGLKANVDIEYQDDGKTIVDDAGDTAAIGDEVDIEQAYFTYAIGDQVSLKAGRFLSYSGWETEEPTGLFQFSGAGYAKYFYGGYQQGTSVMYSADSFDVALSVVNDLGDLEGTARDTSKPGIEAMVGFKPMEGVTVKGFYLTDHDDDKVNVWGSYAASGYTFALEYNIADFATGGEANGYLAMVNYAFDEKIGLTGRYHGWEVEDATGTSVEEMTGITIAPSYKVTSNLLAIAEYRMDSDELADVDTDTVALELLLTF